MGIFKPLRNWVDEFIPYHMEVGGKSLRWFFVVINPMAERTKLTPKKHKHKEVATPKTCFSTVLKEHLESWFRRVFAD